MKTAINALKARSLDRCRDSSMDVFKGIVALAVVGSNQLRLGVLLLAAEAERLREAKRKSAA